MQLTLVGIAALTNGGAEVDVRFEGFHYPFVARVPYSQGLVVRGTDDELATRMEDDAANPVVVAQQGEETNTGTDIPYTNYFVSRARCEERSFMGSLIVRPCSSVDRCSCTVRCPCDTLHYVFVVSEFDLKIELSISTCYVYSSILSKEQRK